VWAHDALWLYGGETFYTVPEGTKKERAFGDTGGDDEKDDKCKDEKDVGDPINALSDVLGKFKIKYPISYPYVRSFQTVTDSPDYLGTWELSGGPNSRRRDHSAAVTDDGLLLILMGVGVVTSGERAGQGVVNDDAWLRRVAPQVLNRLAPSSSSSSSSSSPSLSSDDISWNKFDRPICEARIVDNAEESSSSGIGGGSGGGSGSGSSTGSGGGSTKSSQFDAEYKAKPECGAAMQSVSLQHEIIFFGGLTFAPGSVVYRNSLWALRRVPYVHQVDASR
jgi:hypothetical protein